MGTATGVLFAVFEVLSPLVALAATWAAARAAAWLDADMMQSALRGALERLDAAVISIVKEMQQVTVDELKAKSVDGVLSVMDKRRLRGAAIAKAKVHLGREGYRVLSQALGLSDELLEEFIGTRVEAAVRDLRAASKPAAGR